MTKNLKKLMQYFDFLKTFFLTESNLGKYKTMMKKEKIVLIIASPINFETFQ